MEFEDATPRQIFVYLVLPMAFSGLLFFICFYLKQRELEAYFHPGFRITLIFIASVVGFMSFLLFWMTLVVRILMWFGIVYDEKNSVGNVIFVISVFFVFVPILYTGVKMSAYNSRLEDRALAASGKMLSTVITRAKYVKGKGSHYRYYFKLLDQKNQLFEGSLRRDDDVLKAGDTVTIRFLPANPDVYREVN